MKYKNSIKLSSLLLLLGFAFCSNAQKSASFDENTFYRLTNQWQGEGMSLDVHPDGDIIQMAPTGHYGGQFWKITNLSRGYFRLTNIWQGEGKAIDVINDGNNNRLSSADAGNYSGQSWLIEPTGKGYYRLTNGWQTEKSLDCDSDKNGSFAGLNPIGNYSGQLWKITDILNPSKSDKLKIGDKAHGGIVFYIDESGEHGLVCQEKDSDLMSWGEAKEACESSTVGGKNDWYLPSLNELELMYKNLEHNHLGNFDREWYWSSKVGHVPNMFSKSFLNGHDVEHWDQDHSHVRAVRAFGLNRKAPQKTLRKN